MTRANWFALAVGIGSCVPGIHDALAAQPPAVCATAASDGWQDGYGTWTLTQDSSNNTIQGQVIVGPGLPCPQGQVYGVMGSYQGNGTFTITASYYGFNRPQTCTASVQYVARVTKPGCNNAVGSWTNSDGLNGGVQMHHSCYSPSGEQVARFQGWGSLLFATAAVYNQTVSPANINFGGRSVFESTVTPGTDNCYFTGSSVDPLVAVTSSNTPWIIDTANNYGQDTVGWGIGGVDYYRRHFKAPCGTTIPQTMSIDCDTPARQPYNTNDLNILTITIGDRDVTVSKKNASGTASANKTWGISQSAYKAAAIAVINYLLQLGNSLGTP